ncbi:MAG TPA: hypothetical protein VFV53_02050 [Candidatus Limnocylindrales bacterium]|nr:hypothetical protein [Candidatus Limnocylindrales bacterium]
MTASSPGPTPAPATESDVEVRVAGILREVARGGLAGLIATTIVGGLGGRLVMRVSALLNPGATGLRTENGEVVGAITAEGTLALIVFGGLLGGLAVGVVWVIVSPWLPGRGPRRWLLAMPVAVALGGSFLVRSSNPDFAILEPDWLLITLLLGLVAVIGFAVAWLDERLERALPDAGGSASRAMAAYVIVAILGLLTIGVAIDGFFSSAGSPNPPVRVGWALVATGVVTAAAWVVRVGSSAPTPPAAVGVAGRIGVVVAVILGFAQLVPTVVRLLPAD